MKLVNLIIKHRATIVVFLAITAMGFLLIRVSTVTDQAIIDSTFDEMEQIGVQYEILLTSTLENAKEDLSLLADAIVKNDVASENIIEYFNTQSQIGEFDKLYYIDLDGNGVSVKNEYYDFSEDPSFKHALENDFYIDNPHISADASDVAFDLAIPVLKDNQPIAVLFCEVSVVGFFEIINQNKYYEGDIFFVDSNMKMIFSTSVNHVDLDLIPEQDVIEMGIENVYNAQKDIQNKRNGGFYYDYFGTPKVMVYYPIDLTNIALAMNVHVESLSSEIINAAKYFDMIGMIVYWSIIFLVIYISIMQYRSKKKMIKVAYYDPLTNLPNLAKLELDIVSVLKNNKKHRYTLLVIDIENFKAINEMFGHDMGNRVLKTVKLLSESFNEPSLITARIGSDKFALFAGNSFFDDLSFLPGAVTELYDRYIPELADYGGTFKIGRYHIELGETNFDDIMAKANLAHVKAKTSKGEIFCDYDDTLKNQVKTEADITSKMKSALANNEFQVFLQPKFSTNGEIIVGAEALIRWIEPDGKMIFPNDFIPLFERNGFIIELDKYVLENVCMTIRRWIDMGVGPLAISVNCSRLNLENPFFVDGIVAIANKYNVPHECIEIELTESTTIESELVIEQLFEALHSYGFKISIDDFGAGHSSLGMLKNLQVDTLKMDRSFFVGGKNVRRDDLLIDSIVKMSHNLGMYVVAEGIETADQIKLLKSMNCDAVQGYFYDKPMPIPSFEQKYHAQIIESTLNNKSRTDVIKRINDIKYACSFVPGGIVISKFDENFTIVEANDYFFEMIGYTRAEVSDVFNNQGISIMTPKSKEEILNYFKDRMQLDTSQLMESRSYFITKSGEVRLFRLKGKVAINENGETRVYVSVIDLSDYL